MKAIKYSLFHAQVLKEEQNILVAVFEQVIKTSDTASITIPVTIAAINIIKWKLEFLIIWYRIQFWCAAVCFQQQVNKNIVSLSHLIQKVYITQEVRAVVFPML